ncbi:YdcF family protein [Candidatus Berkelbacteria bacterium]|nr:YdcF family protein [Candidatus Berkelbacteria bacterium]
MDVRVLLVASSEINAVDVLDGTVTKRRLSRALKLWRTDRSQYFLLTGGICQSPAYQRQPAALLMTEWLLDRGVPIDRLLIEPAACDSVENVRNAIRILAPVLGRFSVRVTIVSEWLHAMRLRRHWRHFDQLATLRIEPVEHPRTLWQRGIGWVQLVAAYLDPGGRFFSPLVTAWRKYTRRP